MRETGGGSRAKVHGFDPSWSNDPLARRVEWKLLGREATNLTTHRLRRIDADHFEFRQIVATGVLRGMVPCFLFGGALVIYARLDNPSQLNGALGILLLYIVGALLGIVLFSLFNRRRPQFDLAKGVFLPDRLRADGSAGSSGVPLSRVRALQLLTGAGTSSDSFSHYELNLVLDDASRVRVLAHGGFGALCQDAQELGRVLNVPVWDGTALRGCGIEPSA